MAFLLFSDNNSIKYLKKPLILINDEIRTENKLLIGNFGPLLLPKATEF